MNHVESHTYYRNIIGDLDKMCGRFARYTDLRDFSQLHALTKLATQINLAPSYNVAPSDKSLVVRSVRSEEHIASPLIWGLKPHWLKSSRKSPPINARSETVAIRPMFREAFAKRRCLVICDGYYEWQRRSSDPKQPHYIYAPTMQPFVLAGLWESHRYADVKAIDTFCIVTTPANEDVSHIHERMPVRIPETSYNDWLDPNVSGSELLDDLTHSAYSEWGSHQVSRYINKPMNDSKLCIKPLSVGDRG